MDIDHPVQEPVREQLTRNSQCGAILHERDAMDIWDLRAPDPLVDPSGKVLAETLRDLERDGVVTRTAYDEMPLRVEYELTALGRTLREPLTALGLWAEQHIEEVLDARDAYDQRPL